MFNPTNLDEVCVQVTHLEARDKNFPQETSKKPSKYGDKGKGKFRGKGNKNATIKKEWEKLTCKHCSKGVHDEDHCWKLHPELRPKKLNNKGKQNIVVDVLSRKEEDTNGLLCVISFPQSKYVEEARIEWQQDEKIWKIIQRL